MRVGMQRQSAAKAEGSVRRKRASTAGVPHKHRSHALGAQATAEKISA